MYSWEFDILDREIGKIKPTSYILFHEMDARSRGRELIFEFMKRKLEKGSLMSFFNVSCPLSVLFAMFKRHGIEPEKSLESDRFAIIDTFGSIYNIKYNVKNVWHIEGSISIELLSPKTAHIVKRIKERWAQMWNIHEKELWGVVMDISEYERIFSEEETLRYLEVAGEVRRRHEAYIKFPKGTNIWVYSGEGSRVLPSLYRRSQYVLRTKSEITEDGVKRELIVLKTPKLGKTRRFEYAFTKEGIKIRPVD